MNSKNKWTQKMAAGCMAMVLMMSGLSGCSTVSSASPLQGDGQGLASDSQSGSTGVALAEEADAGAVREALAGYEQDNEKLAFSDTGWHYDAEHDVYWQIGVSYCAEPDAPDYETMGIYVPGAYMAGTDNGDGTYTCVPNTDGNVGGYTAATAPVVFPVNTAGYSAQEAPGAYQYDGLGDYLEAGFVYVYAGLRGRSNGYDEAGELIYSGGAPWGVTDLKAAVRYYRFHQDVLPGDMEQIYCFGMSGGGAQTAVMGASGDSMLYYDYLTSIGAAMFDQEGNYISDAITGTMAWCPITSLDYANEAYEWNMGQYTEEGSRADGSFTAALSKDLAQCYAAYVNTLGLTDEDGNLLQLEASEEGIYTAGTYYDYLVSVVEESLNHFLEDTEFPYTAKSGEFHADGGFAGGGQSQLSGMGPGNGDGERPQFDGRGLGNGDGEMSPRGEDDISMERGGMLMERGSMPMESDGILVEGDGMSAGRGGMMIGQSGMGAGETGVTYETPQDYIDYLNQEEEWVSYDASTGMVKITGMKAFVTYCKKASKDVGAFDDLQKSQAENMVFGNDESDAVHWDSIMAKLMAEHAEEYAALDGWDAAVAADYAADMDALDVLGKDLSTRQNMYNPMYYVSKVYEGYGTSRVAAYWRIHTGIEQGDTALTVETNLALALKDCADVASLEFETVWGQGHTMAERTGESTENFINWVNECCRSSV